jgi:SNF2 family DNA or RNA helicase
MIYYNNNFDYGKRIQSEDRIYRIGQDKNCHIIDIICENTIDQRIEESILKKSSLSREIRRKLKEIKENTLSIDKFSKEILLKW